MNTLMHEFDDSTTLMRQVLTHTDATQQCKFKKKGPPFPNFINSMKWKHQNHE